MLFFAQGSVAACQQFFDRFWPEARAVSDEQRIFYTGFSLGRVGWRDMLHPQVWWRGVSALLHGHGTGRPHGDVRQLPGMLLARGENILWQHSSRHPADRPRPAELVGLLQAASAMDHQNR